MSSRHRPPKPSSAVEAALQTGYRHIDTAAAYGNEREVGEAIRRSGLGRGEVFIETKIWISDFGYDQTLHAFDKGAGKLGVEQIDLLILHQALPGEFDLTIGAYKRTGDALRRRQSSCDRRLQLHASPPGLAAGRDRGGARGQPDRGAPVLPAVRIAASYDQAHGILNQAWAPIGGITFYREGPHTSTLENPVIGDYRRARTPRRRHR